MSRKFIRAVQGPTLIILAHLGAWDEWLDVFEVTRAVWILGVALCAVWFWKSAKPRPLQLELWPA